MLGCQLLWPGCSAHGAGPFVSLGAGYAHNCGVKADGSVQCWGGIAGGPERDVESAAEFVRVVPAGKYLSVDAGHGYSCGVRTNGTLKCWGVIGR